MYEGNQLNTLINRLRAAFIGRDEGIYLPFINYVAEGATTNGYIAISSIAHRATITKWTQAYFVQTTNNGSNYWTIQLDDGVTAVKSFTTAAVGPGGWAVAEFYKPDLTQPTGAPSAGWLGVEIVKTGSPGALYWAAPAVLAM